MAGSRLVSVMTPRTENLIAAKFRALARVIADRSVPGPALRRLVTTMGRDQAVLVATAPRAGGTTAAAALAAAVRAPPVAGEGAWAAARDGVRVVAGDPPWAAAIPAGIAAIAAHPATPTAAPPMRTIRDARLAPESNPRHERRRLTVNRSIITGLLP
jgi:hypothetical protein